jgi:hypothetical protein
MSAASLDLARLARLLELASSEHDGESAQAGRRAHAMVRAAGMSWEDVLLDGAATDADRLPSWREPEDVASAIELCREFVDHFTGWEIAFLENLPNFHRYSEKQIRRLEQLVDKCRRVAKAEEFSS